MCSLPINIVNLICEWAAQEDIDWHPFFCLKTNNLSWKVNKYSRKFLERGDIILHNRLDSYMIEGKVDIIMLYNNIAKYLLDYKAILFQFIDGSFNLYVSIEIERDNSKKDKYIYRAMLKFDGSDEGGNLIKTSSERPQYLFQNETNYAIVIDSWYRHNDKKLVLFIHHI